MARGKPKKKEKEPTYQEQFRARVERVLAAMRAERIDFRGVAFIRDDGGIGTRVVPIESGNE